MPCFPISTLIGPRCFSCGTGQCTNSYQLGDSLQYCLGACLLGVQTGQLIFNGGFEDPLGPFTGWITTGAVATTDNGAVHQGAVAAVLGFDGVAAGAATLSQIITGICPFDNYELTFFLRGLGIGDAGSNAPVTVTLEWLDALGNPLVPPSFGLNITIPANSLMNDGYTGYFNLTTLPPSVDVRQARLTFSITAADLTNAVILDDVSLIPA